MRTIQTMRSAALACALLCGACNGLTGVGKYVLDGDDAGTVAQDASAPNESGVGGGPSCPVTTSAVIAKCSDAELAAELHTDPADPRLIRAPSDDKEAPFVPNCVTIKAGQTVTWTGDLTAHPLIPREDSTVPNPILPTGSGVTQATATFLCPGDFNFSCRVHRDAMLGTVRVIP
jgi:plastocyanin